MSSRKSTTSDYYDYHQTRRFIGYTVFTTIPGIPSHCECRVHCYRSRETNVIRLHIQNAVRLNFVPARLFTIHRANSLIIIMPKPSQPPYNLLYVPCSMQIWRRNGTEHIGIKWAKPLPCRFFLSPVQNLEEAILHHLLYITVAVTIDTVCTFCSVPSNFLITMYIQSFLYM